MLYFIERTTTAGKVFVIFKANEFFDGIYRTISYSKVVGASDGFPTVKQAEDMLQHVVDLLELDINDFRIVQD